ncbi:MAG: Zn-dependent hydrolase [Deltaproteobacteria bacterium]|nr:Zn-dependent hydrolase [Deltaproteobacteria bacterium]
MECSQERIKKDIDTINAANMTPGKGVTRLTWSPEYMTAYRYVIDELEKIGAEVTICLAGAIRGRLAGSEPGKPVVMSGSHIDTVINGGQFDGQVGTFSALEAARIIALNNVPHTHPIDVVVFPEEEGAGFGIGLGGSSVWTGDLELERLYQAKNRDGVTYQEAMAAAGVTVEDQAPLESEKIKNMLEIHIEQSVVLDQEGVSIGVIESIAGMKWSEIIIEGVANHAGGTPMSYRNDAFQGAVRVIAGLEEIAANQMGPNTVGTCGFVKVEPGSANVIPGRVEMIFDMRDSDSAYLDKMPKKVKELAEGICQERGLGLQMRERISVPPVKIQDYLVKLIHEKSRGRGVEALGMMSGALHDSCKLADLTDIGMIFVPSKDGRSHCPEEWTDWQDIKIGADILLDTIIELAK